MARPKLRTIRSRLVPVMLGLGESAGADVAAWRARFDLPSDANARRELEVPLETLHRLSELLAAALGDPHWGLHLAARAPRGSYGVIEFCCRTAPTVRDAVQRLTRYSALVSDLEVFTWRARGRSELVERTLPAPPTAAARHDNEFSLAYLVRIARELLGEPTWSPRRVWFANPPPGDTRELAAFFGTATLQFDALSSGVEVDRADLDRPNVCADPALFEVLEEQIERLAPAAPDDLRARVRNAICLSLRNGSPTLPAVAKLLAVSTRTLQRQLADEATTFQALVDDTRAELAKEYLADRERPLGEVTFLLGYAEPSAFVRAFRRWTGQSITAYRATMLEERTER